MSITLKQAEKMISVAKNKSVELDTKMNIAIVDAGANLVAFARMDGAWLGSLDISIKKAKTARFFDMNTGVIGELSQPGGSLYNIEHSNNGLITFPGGVPVKDANGNVIGASTMNRLQQDSSGSGIHQGVAMGQPPSAEAVVMVLIYTRFSKRFQKY